jgi:hypothetical protein
MMMGAISRSILDAVSAKGKTLVSIWKSARIVTELEDADVSWRHRIGSWRWQRNLWQFWQSLEKLLYLPGKMSVLPSADEFSLPGTRAWVVMIFFWRHQPEAVDFSNYGISSYAHPVRLKLFVEN